MQTSLDQIKRIQVDETFSPVAVEDSAVDGKIMHSIGFGHQIQPYESYLMDATIDIDKATELEQQDIAKEIEPWVNKFCVHINNVTQNMYDALVDICYNVGPGVLRYHFAQAILNGSGQATISNLWTQTAITTIVNGERVEEDGLKVRRKNEVELYFS